MTQHTDCETFGPHPVLLLLSHWLFVIDTPPHPALKLFCRQMRLIPTYREVVTEFSSRVYAGKDSVIWMYFLLLISLLISFRHVLIWNRCKIWNAWICMECFSNCICYNVTFSGTLVFLLDILLLWTSASVVYLYPKAFTVALHVKWTLRFWC